MLEQLMQMAQQMVPQTLPAEAQQQGISQEAITQEATQSIFSGMQDILQQGGPGALKGLFQGAQQQDPNNPQVQQISNNFAGNISNKLGISSGMAKTIAMAVIPMLLSRVFNRAKDPNDNGFSITDILGSLAGGGMMGGNQGGGLGGMLGGMLGGNQGNNAGGGLGGMLGGMLGGNQGGNYQSGAAAGNQGGLGGMLDRDGDGDTDLNDLIGMFR